MSQPTNPKAFDRSLLEQALKDLANSPSGLEVFLQSALEIGLGTMSIRTRYDESEQRFKAEMVPPRDIWLDVVRPEISPLDLELARQAMAIREREVIFASSQPFTPVEPSPSSIVPSNLSADSLLTSFLSTTSSKSSGSKSTSSKSGPPKLLSSHSKETATRNSSLSSGKSSRDPDRKPDR